MGIVWLLRATMWLLALGWGQGLACAYPICGDEIYKAGPGVPLIREVVLHSTLEGDPWTMVLAITVEDSDGDLDGGKLYHYRNAGTPQTQDLAELLRRAQIPPQVTSATFASVITVAPRNLPDGTVLRLGTRIQDGRGKSSNCYALDLQFKVTPQSSGWTSSAVQDSCM